MNCPESKKITVCILSLDAFPLFDPSLQNHTLLGRVGGAELQMYYYARELARDDQFDVHVIVDNFGQKSLELHENVHLHKCAFRLSSIDAPELLPGVNQRLRLLRCLQRLNPDVCVHRSISIQTFLISVYCRITNTSFLYMMSHDGGAIPTLDPDRDKKGWYIYRRLYEYGMTRADQIVVQNDDQKRALQQNYGYPAQIRPSAHPIPERNQSEEEPEYVSWIARCERRKQPGLFLDLTAQFPHTSFLMIMPQADGSDFGTRIKQRALNKKNVTFLDYVPHHKIDQYFKNSRVFVNTSDTEGFPNTFVEAARTNTPILSYKVNPNGILHEYHMGICAEARPANLEDSLRFLLNNATSRRKMGKRAREYAMDHHNLEKIIEHDKNQLRSLVHNDR